MTFILSFCTFSKGLGHKISNKDILSPSCSLALGAKAALRIKHLKHAEQNSLVSPAEPSASCVETSAMP